MAEYKKDISEQNTTLSQEHQSKSGQFEQAKTSEQKRQADWVGDNFKASEKLDEVKTKMKDMNPFKEDK